MVDSFECVKMNGPTNPKPNKCIVESVRYGHSNATQRTNLCENFTWEPVFSIVSVMCWTVMAELLFSSFTYNLLDTLILFVYLQQTYPRNYETNFKCSCASASSSSLHATYCTAGNAFTLWDTRKVVSVSVTCCTLPILTESYTVGDITALIHSANTMKWLCSVLYRLNTVKGKGKVHPCTGTEALYRPYGP